MTRQEVQRLLDQADHALADLPPQTREPLAAIIFRLARACLADQDDLERLADGTLIRRLQKVHPS